MIRNQTVPQGFVVMILTTVEFQICQCKMSKKGGSSQVSQVFFVSVCTFLFFLLCVPGRVQGFSHAYHQYYVYTCIAMGRDLAQSKFAYSNYLYVNNQGIVKPKQSHAKSCNVCKSSRQVESHTCSVNFTLLWRHFNCIHAFSGDWRVVVSTTGYVLIHTSLFVSGQN